MKYKTVSELTELNIKLHKSAEAFIKITDKAKADIQAVKDEVNERYFGKGSPFTEMSKAQKRQFADSEIRKATSNITKQFNDDSKSHMHEVGGFTEAIQDAQELYDPIRRVSLETSTGDAATSRAAIQQLIAGATLPELETLLSKYEATNDLPGIAAISAVASRDSSIRKQLPNARIVKNAKFGDEDQLDAIFHAGNNITGVLVGESRGVTASVNHGSRGTSRIESGLRGMKVEDGKVVDTRQAGGES